MKGGKAGVDWQIESKSTPHVIQAQCHCVTHRPNPTVTDYIKETEALKKFWGKFCSLYTFISGQ